MVRKCNHQADHGDIPDNKMNILKRKSFTRTSTPDSTYIHLQKERWIYLAFVINSFNRKISGYAYGISIDLGNQYTSQASIVLLRIAKKFT